MIRYRTTTKEQNKNQHKQHRNENELLARLNECAPNAKCMLISDANVRYIPLKMHDISVKLFVARKYCIEMNLKNHIGQVA